MEVKGGGTTFVHLESERSLGWAFTFPGGKGAAAGQERQKTLHKLFKGLATGISNEGFGLIYLEHKEWL